MTNRDSRPLTLIIAAFILVGGLAARAGLQDANSTREGELALQTAMQKETVDGDLTGAIDGYRQVVARFAANRPLAARALLRMAECYQKQGNAEAQKIYERLARDYADVPAVASRARARLGAARPDRGISTTRVSDSAGSWDRVSPDGRYLAFVDWDTNNLAVRELSTGTTRPLTSNSGVGEQYPLSSAFSADGTQIAYEWFMDEQLRGVLRITSTAAGSGAAPRTIYDNPEVETVAPTDWSPDGKWIAAVVRRKDHTAQIGVVSVADGTLRVLKTVDWARVGGLRFSPDSSRLAYHRPQQDGRAERDVFVIALDGTRETAAAASPGDDVMLEWTPDGQRLLVASDRGGSTSVWSVASNGQGATSSFELVKSDVGIITSLGVTRSGALYYNLLPSGSDIYVAQFDNQTGRLSSPPTQPVQQFRGFNSTPEWSPDGKYLAYASRRDVPAPINATVGVVAVLSMETGAVAREMHPALSYGWLGRWSPDGGSFIARGSDLKGRSGIVKVNATTGEAALAASDETCSGMPFWASDGMSFFCYRGEAEQIVQLDARSGAVLRTLAASGQGAGVSPDGQTLVYGDGKTRVLRLLTLASGETREVLRLKPPQTHIFNWNSVAWTPDGRGIVFYGRVAGDEGMWLVPIDGAAPHKINVDVKPIIMWRFNPVTGQVAFTGGTSGRLETWRMDHFLEPAATARLSGRP